ncbi:AAA family ATPase [Micropruina sp.]|uniref:AAA family ATPase n=1 Tax=Micropruina sp. TaxID=2737536 RepID=UPI0039E4991F
MPSQNVFVGRRQELSLLADLRTQLGEHGSAIVVEGAPGVGKTALIEQFVRSVSGPDMVVLRASGTPTESLAPYSGLHLLLQPFLHQVSELPQPQRDALRTAFGVQPGAPPTPFLAGLATLTLLSDQAEDRPVLIIVEDLHWFDPASRSALMIVARRIASDPILMVMTMRSGQQWEAEGVRRLELSPLSFIEANLILDNRPDRPAGAVRRILLNLAAGNPLALVELSASDVVSEDPDLFPVTSRLERAFAGRYRELPQPARLTVLAAALNGRESIHEATSAVSRALGGEPEHEWLVPAIEVGLIEHDLGQIRFRHPLVRSAVASASSLAERSMIMRALVHVVDDPERTVWWRAELATAAEPDLADQLDRRAGANLAVGDSARATAALRRAADLTVDADLRGDRLVRAADAARHAGAFDVADDLLRRADVELQDLGARARALWIREMLPTGQSALERGDFGPALHAIDAMCRTGQTNEALRALLQLASSVWDHATDVHPSEQFSAAARNFDLDRNDPRMLLLSAVIEPSARAPEIVEHIRLLPEGSPGDPETQWCLGYALNLSGDVELSADYLRRSATGLRRRGDTALLPHALMGLSWECHLLGAFAEGRALIDECLTMAADLNDHTLAAAARAAHAWYDAIDGVPPDKEAIVRASRVAPHTLETRDLQATLVVAQGRAALAAGRPRDALPALLRLTDPSDPAYKPMFRIISLPDLVEAAASTGDLASAQEQVRLVTELTDGWQVASIEGALGLAKIMLADESTLDELAERLINHPLPVPLFHARAHLNLGSKLRRARRVDDARRHLRIALDAFESFPAPIWAAWCREELRASGERLPDARPSGRHVLTPQELRISSLAASGFSNREIAEQLFLSPRTIGAHLYSAFRKLGITSREQLAHVLAPHDQPALRALPAAP